MNIPVVTQSTKWCKTFITFSAWILSSSVFHLVNTQIPVCCKPHVTHSTEIQPWTQYQLSGQWHHFYELQCQSPLRFLHVHKIIFIVVNWHWNDRWEDMQLPQHLPHSVHLYLLLWTFLWRLSALSDVKHSSRSVHEYCPPVCFIVWTHKFERRHIDLRQADGLQWNPEAHRKITLQLFLFLMLCRCATVWPPLHASEIFVDCNLTLCLILHYTSLNVGKKATISWKRCKIQTLLLQATNNKWYIRHV